MVYYPPKDILEWSNLSDSTNGTQNVTHNYIVGLVYIFLSVFYLAAYILCIIVICKNESLIKKSYYLIVVNMGATDMLQLVFNGIAAGSFTLVGKTEYYSNKICGGLMNFCWVIFCAMAHLLALNRLVQVYSTKSTVNKIFSLRNTKIYLTIIWIYGAAWFLAYMTPNISVLYFVRSYDWNYVNNTNLSRVLYYAEFIQDSFHAVCMVIWYSLIFCKLKLMLQNIQNNQINEDKKEFRVLLQAFIVCLMIILTVIGFFVIQKLSETKWARFASNLTWITCSGSNCFVYFIFDSSIKRKLSEMFIRNPSPANL